ncbi:hypothetical protein KKF59_03290 [Patescibacteria group bacterium]|nr:hypothetical protein [Patescibacteria group bacterium]MBU1034892.1 hypothetical protein [Patescibacteria group bacterium]MBU1629650.1 hypothetical protein [Patescibacteria group bacterium]MBU1908128.1 hypothetical protein [Patescibacteria group bacterium]
MFLATCGPTAIGKTYQMQRLIKLDARRFAPVLSVTTRQRRNLEDGSWYGFVSSEALAGFDPADVISDVTFRGEHYLLLKSEIEKALKRAPIAFMAIVPPVILLMREKGIAHSLINCHVGDAEVYAGRLSARGYKGDDLAREKAAGMAFVYPPQHPDWPQADIKLCASPEKDNEEFSKTVIHLAGDLLPESLLSKI